MKYKLVIETTNREFHRILWDKAREVAHEYGVNFRGEQKQSTNVIEIKLQAELHARRKLRNDEDGNNPIIELK